MKQELTPCSFGHEEIVFYGYTCPLCAALARVKAADEEVRSMKEVVATIRAWWEAEKKGGAA